MPKKRAIIKTPFGKYLSDRSVNKADLSRKTGLTTTRIARLCTDPKAFLRAYELQLIALAIKVDPCQMQRDLFGNLELKKEDKELSDQEKLNIQILEYLKDSKIIENENFNIKDIERIGKILVFCEDEKTENEILKCLALQRKSPNFNTVLKVAVKVNWLRMKQTKENGITSTNYTTTEEGKKVSKLTK